MNTPNPYIKIARIIGCEVAKIKEHYIGRKVDDYTGIEPKERQFYQFLLCK